MDINLKFDEIKEFLADICNYLKHEIKSLDYQNTCSNFDIAENRGQELLGRCELILKYFQRSDPVDDKFEPITVTENSYLDMNRKIISTSTPEAQPNEYVLINPLPIVTGTITDPIDTELYDICTVTDSNSKSIDDNNDLQNCPYFGLPAAHLIIKKSPKLGQLTRIEKRFIFDQSKKYFCGILGDWLLCYADSQTSLKPLLCVQLSGVDIEHYGEGKRRDLCFQITNSDASKKYIFQSTSEIETKIWIHAIEAAIRGDHQTIAIGSESGVAITTSPVTKSQMKFHSQNLRKLPTPPVQLKFTNNRDNVGEDIYEEPCPLYNIDMDSIETIAATENSQNSSPSSIRTRSLYNLSDEITRYEYDVPKRSNQPIISPVKIVNDSNDVSPENETQSLSSPIKLEFQTKIKDVQMQLTNQLSSPARSPGTIKSPKTTIITNSNSIKRRDKKSSNPSTGSTSETTVPVAATITPVRNWFLNRLNKTASGAVQSTQQSILKIQKHHSNEIQTVPLTYNLQNRIVAAQPKGEKVNMIINQLEANGRLPIFKNKTNRRLSDVTESSLTDDSNYELINAIGNV